MFGIKVIMYLSLACAFYGLVAIFYLLHPYIFEGVEFIPTDRISYAAVFFWTGLGIASVCKMIVHGVFEK